MKVLVYLSPSKDRVPFLRNAFTKFLCLFYEEYKMGEIIISPFNQVDTINKVSEEFALDCSGRDNLSAYDIGILVIDVNVPGELPYKLGKRLEEKGINTFYMRENVI